MVGVVERGCGFLDVYLFFIFFSLFCSFFRVVWLVEDRECGWVWRKLFLGVVFIYVIRLFFFFFRRVAGILGGAGFRYRSFRCRRIFVRIRLRRREKWIFWVKRLRFVVIVVKFSFFWVVNGRVGKVSEFWNSRC